MKQTFHSSNGKTTIYFILIFFLSYGYSPAQFIILDKTDSSFITHIRVYEKSAKILLRHSEIVRKAFVLSLDSSIQFCTKSIIDSLAISHKDFSFIQQMYKDSLLVSNQASIYLYAGYEASKIDFLTQIRYIPVQGHGRVDKRYCIMRYHPQIARLYSSPFDSIEVITRNIKLHWSYLLSML